MNMLITCSPNWHSNMILLPHWFVPQKAKNKCISSSVELCFSLSDSRPWITLIYLINQLVLVLCFAQMFQWFAFFSGFLPSERQLSDVWISGQEPRNLRLARSKTHPQRFRPQRLGQRGQIFARLSFLTVNIELSITLKYVAWSSLIQM